MEKYEDILMALLATVKDDAIPSLCGAADKVLDKLEIKYAGKPLALAALKKLRSGAEIPDGEG